MLKFTFPRSRCSSKGEDITKGGFSFIQISLIITIGVIVWHNIFPPTIEERNIHSMFEILKNWECSFKVKNLGFGHKMNAHANCKCNVMWGMGYMKEFPNNTTIIYSNNKRKPTCQF